jgi:hypothetical protein
MRFNIGTTITSNSQNESGAIALEFGIYGNQLTALGSANTSLDVIVQCFDPDRDIFYRISESLNPEELAEEVEIHVPLSLKQKLNGRIVSGTLHRLVLMQHIASACPAIPPLTVLQKILETVGSVNSAILQADRGGILFVYNGGKEFHAGASRHSLKEFINLSVKERERIFPDFHAFEIIMSGSDLDHFQNLDLGPLSTSRRITISDFAGICELTSESRERVELNPHLYTLAIGAAAVYAEILRKK